MNAEQKYMEARERLNEAMAEFVTAADGVGKGAYQIAGDVVDSLFDASGGAVKIEGWATD
jgi:hypothetical protein